MEKDRVRNASSEEVNLKVEQDILKNLVFYKQNPDQIPHRLTQLEEEPDIEKAFETNASALSLTGVVFGLLFGKKWLLVPAVVTGFLLQHALQGWCPPLVVFRKMGFRTRKEIETEKHALKLLHGDYDAISSGEENNPEETLETVKGSSRIISDQPLTTSGMTRTSRKRKIDIEE
jgi:hypothetical protein